MRNDCKKCGSFGNKSLDKELEICDICYWKEKYKELIKEYNTLKSCNNCAHEGSSGKCNSCVRNESIPTSRRCNLKGEYWINKFTSKKTCRTCGSYDCNGCVNLCKWVKRQ